MRIHPDAEKKYTPEEIQNLDEAIDRMSVMEMARRWRFALSGDPYFRTDLPLHKHFKKKFWVDLGGFTPEISKTIGWET